MSGKHEKLAYRLARIISRLNDGERLDIHQLKDEFQVSIPSYKKTSTNASTSSKPNSSKKAAATTASTKTNSAT